MSFAAQYPPVLTAEGDMTSEVLGKYNQEFQYLYTNLLSALFSATTGHAHTGNGSDGAKITTSALVDNAITTVKITDANVTTAKIADGSITIAKMAAEYKSSLFLEIYPIGAIYMSVASTSPATLFGGTWTQIKDRFLLSCGDTYANGATGGEATHTLSEAEMPSHSHIETVGGRDNGGDNLNGIYPSSCNNPIQQTNSPYTTSYTGGNAAHNNMPPYLAVYVWKRTA